MKRNDIFGDLKKNNPRLFPPIVRPSPSNPNGLLHSPKRGLGSGTKGGGYLPRYPSAEALEFAIDTYFEGQYENHRPPTMAGLALALGFKSVAALKNYEQKGEEYAELVETARTQVEAWKNELLLSASAPQGVIFDLKNNHGWSDKISQETTITPSDTLTELLKALQGKVLRPVLDETIPHRPIDFDSIEDADYRDVDFEEATGVDLDSLDAQSNDVSDIEDMI